MMAQDFPQTERVKPGWASGSWITAPALSARLWKSKACPEPGRNSTVSSCRCSANPIKVMKRLPARARTLLSVRATQCLCLAAWFLGFSLTHAANLLVNSGFEINPLSGWQSYGANNYSESDGQALSGTYYYKVYG